MLLEVGMHNHSNFSDGSQPPEELCKKVKEQGIKGCCLTDHDCWQGLDKFEETANELGVETISGIEISCLFKDKYWVHILGYGIKYRDIYADILSDFVRPAWDAFNNWTNKIRQKMHEYNLLHISPDEIVHMAYRVGPFDLPLPLFKAAEKRLQIPWLTIQKDLLFIDNPFADIINNNKLVGPAEAVDCVKRVGGKAVLAHPGLFSIRSVNNEPENQADFQELIKILVDSGLSGLEVYYPLHSMDQTAYFTKLAKKYGLWQTAGSDYHGDWSFVPGIGPGMLGMSFKEFLKFKEFCQK